jgi:hypothetical protein
MQAELFARNLVELRQQQGDQQEGHQQRQKRDEHPTRRGTGK